MSVAADAGRHDARLFEVSVPGAQTVADAATGKEYTAYTVRCKGPAQGTWEVRKRYSDFPVRRQTQ